MSWNTPWSKPRAVDARAKALEEEELELNRRMEELQRQMEALRNPPPPTPTQPVWRSPKSAEPLPSDLPAPSKKLTRTNRARQKQDRNLFILLFAVVLFIVFLVLHAIFGH